MLALGPQIFEALEKTAWSSESVPEGEMRARLMVDANTGKKQNVWIGERSYVRDFVAQNGKARIRDPREFTGRADDELTASSTFNPTLQSTVRWASPPEAEILNTPKRSPASDAARPKWNGSFGTDFGPSRGDP